MRSYLFIFSLCLILLPAAASAQSLTATTTVDSSDPINWSYWDSPGGVDAVFYGWTATTTVSVCAVQVPISRYTSSTPDGQQIPITVGIVASTSTDPTNTTFITNTSFSAALYSEDYPIAIQPGVDSATVFFTVVPGSNTIACQEIQEGETIWIKVRDLDFPAGSGDARMRYGNNLSLSGNGRWCYRFGGDTLATSCTDGGGTLRILNDATLENFNLIFNEPEADAYGFNDSDYGVLGTFIKDVLKYLFTPSNESLQMYEDSQDLISTKLPFGLFSMASGTFAGIGEESTTTTAIGFVVSSTAGDIGGYNETIDIFTPSDIENTIPSGLLTFIRSIAALGMYTLFFVWIWYLATTHPDKI